MTRPITRPARAAGWPADIWLVAALGLAATAVALTAMPWPANLCAAILAWLMIPISISDARRFIVPDTLSLPAIVIGLLASGEFATSGSGAIASVQNLAGMAAGAAAFLAIRSGYRAVRRRDGMGLGDVKLAAAAGAWTGLAGLPHVVLAAAVSALIFVAVSSLVTRRPDSTPPAIRGAMPVPFGAFLAPAIWLVYVVQLL